MHNAESAQMRGESAPFTHDVLIEREDRYERLIELAADGMLIHDGERITAVNAATLRLAGATSHEQLVGQPIQLVLHPPYLRAVGDRLIGARSSSDLAPAVRDTFHRLDGGAIPVEIRAQLFLVRGQPSAHLTIRDISERLQLEAEAHEVAERLQTAQRLESVGMLASGVAHEVNNMLQIILGFGGLLLEEPQASDAARADAREIVRAAAQAAAITRQLLQYSRHGVHHPTMLVLSDAVRDLESVMHRLLGDNRRLSLEIEASPAAWIDSGQIEQVLVNLLLNARHATSDEGRVVVSTGTMLVDADLTAANGAVVPCGRYATLTVRDNGTGMSASTSARIFEPFFTTKRSEDGTGLGLSAVQGIMAQHGGFILVSSALNVGTSMSLLWTAIDDPKANDAKTTPSLPVSTRGRALSSAQSATDSTTGAANVEAAAAADRILVVDDEAAVRAVARRMLERAGYLVSEAASGADAIELIAQSGQPALVLSDVRMPAMGGIELARRIRERWPSLPLLLMSGDAAEAERSTTASRLELDFIEKPFGIEQLLQRIRGLLTRTMPA